MGLSLESLAPTRKYIFSFFVTFRILSLFLVQSYFVPDEYWQSLEVAHLKVFGYGHETWEWKEKIRSSFYPFLVYILYSVMNFFSMDFTFLVIHTPRLMQAILTAYGDFYTHKLCLKLYGETTAKISIFVIITSWFSIYCGSRTLTNTAEMAFSAIGYYYYPWERSKERNSGFFRRNMSFLWFAGLACLVRPTALLIWGPLILSHLSKQRKLFSDFVCELGFIGLIFIMIQLLLDSFWYEGLFFTPWKFFEYNWLNNIGAFYGTHSFHWYFTQGLPVVLTTHTVLFFISALSPSTRPLFVMSIIFVIFLSLTSHKEFRFLLPIFPLIFCGCSQILSKFYSINRKYSKLFMITMVVINWPLLIYTGLYHKMGSILVMNAIQKEAILNPKMHLKFLMPCHSTPYYSHIHQNISMDFLTCEPNFENDEDYRTDQDDFHFFPEGYMYTNYKKKSSLPTHLVMYSCVEWLFKKYLKTNQYEMIYQTFYANILDNPRTSRDIMIYRKPNEPVFEHDVRNYDY